MTHAANFAVSSELSEAFVKADGLGLRALLVRIDMASEMFVLSKQLPRASDEKADFVSVVRPMLSEAEACYVLFCYDAGEWACMSYVPDDAPVKEKMLYSSAKDTLRKTLGGPEAIPREQHWSSLDDVALVEELSAEAKKAEQESLLTSVERLKIEADRLAEIEAAGDKVSSVVGLSFPATADAAAALGEFASGATGLLVLAIEKEQLALRASVPSTDPAGIAASLPADPCYCLYRWAHERGGAQASSVLFLYMCPEEAAVRSKMLHASSKAGVLSSLGAIGIDVAKSIEGVEAAEISEAELTTQLYGAEAQAAVQITKAAPKGGRRLIRKPRPEAEAE
jgi:twinfilin-like protein